MWAPLLILEGLPQHYSSSYEAGSHFLQSVRLLVVLELPAWSVSQTEPIRTCRIDTILKHGLDFAKDLGKRNTRDLAKLIQVGQL